ncbi:MAG TPA: ATP-binding protein [Stellaceae bacterium]|nr:ATP-binding protein [Stellaceae bacterium]
MAHTEGQGTRSAAAGPTSAWRVAFPRLLLGGLVLALPGFAALATLAALDLVDPVAAIVAAAFVYGGIVLLLKPLVFGVASVQAAIETMAGDDRANPEIETWAPSIQELWLSLGRWVRYWRLRLRAREDELEAARSVLAALPEPLLLLNADRRVVRANGAAEALLGDRLLDRDLAGALRQPLVLAAVDAVLRGEGRRIVEFDLTTPVERHLSASIAPLETQTSDGAAAVLLLNDLTALKRSEQLRADFVANASHELRTPLASLVGFIETLRGPARDDRAAGERFLGIMAEQAARMQRLVEDLLSLSRIEMNEHRPPVGAVDLGSVVLGVVDALEQRAASRGMRLDMRLPEDMPPVQGDADELAQVFQNLIDNAIKYSGPGTAVEIVANRSTRLLPGARSGQRAAISLTVRDHGPGIAREHLPRLTERFYRVDAARSRELGGTGLGLAIVKHIVNHHRGTLEIESEPGQGSTFTVHLPAAPLS